MKENYFSLYQRPLQQLESVAQFGPYEEQPLQLEGQ